MTTSSRSRGGRHLDPRDGLALAGVALIAAGLWMIYPPVALIGTGALLVGVALQTAQRGG